MKIYSYVIRDDKGLAPNPFWDYCTLALDQALIRLVAKPGDWIVGLKETSEKIEDHSLLFAMQVKEKLTFDQYWNDERFQSKKPDFTIDGQIHRIGDNIYEPSSNNSYRQHFSYHAQDYIKDQNAWEKQQKDDLEGKYVLISGKNDFLYFGNKPEKIPDKKLIDILYCDIGHKCIADPIVPKAFLEFIEKLKTAGKIGFLNPPEKWKKQDDSWKDCKV
ncbi:MAG: hypothetical protein ACFFDW_16550 [Candidatus Thorarchaeota archaeon]